MGRIVLRFIIRKREIEILIFDNNFGILLSRKSSWLKDFSDNDII